MFTVQFFSFVFFLSVLFMSVLCHFYCKTKERPLYYTRKSNLLFTMDLKLVIDVFQ